MKKISFLTLMVLITVFLTQCAHMQKWPTYERTAEDRMTVIQQKIGDGLKSGALTAEDGKIFLGRLEDVRRDYLSLRDQYVYRDDWKRLLGRLDILEDEVTSAIARPPRIEGSVIEDRLITLQRSIDDARIHRRLTQSEAEGFQGRLDSVRSDYLRLKDSGLLRTEDRTEIHRRLDLLEADLARYQ
ncbi:MAG TPA: hypothetical protein VK435_00725 [Thermodesulfovibrionales bacterium]|nr:hypothetical protein [Thermodesulfovibrionales bacterium]